MHGGAVRWHMRWLLVHSGAHDRCRESPHEGDVALARGFATPFGELLLRRAWLDAPWGVGRGVARAELMVEPAVMRALTEQRDDAPWGTR